MSRLLSGEPLLSGRQAASTMTGTARKPRTGGSQGCAPLLSDEQILELRALYQFAGWAPDALMLRFKVDKHMVKRVTEGFTRSRLVATLKHLPAGVKPR
ncbi:hypothetical protein [Pseudomonas sp.]|uniref:hypothetical protein n=1 Tax=Pseudomonas sp. TaxID=306 RepID=UPI003FD70D0A